MNNINNLSIGTETVSSSINMHGGSFWDFFSLNNDKYKDSILALEEASERNYAAVKDMILKDMIDPTVVDKNKNTILHYIARDYTANNIDEEIVKKLLSRNDRKSFINLQNIDGDTPAIVALKNGNQELVNMLEKAGADLKIKNNEDYYIGTETQNDNQCEQQNTLSSLQFASTLNNLIPGIANTTVSRLSDLPNLGSEFYQGAKKRL